jgi:transcriptional regulator with XRE-family HTH domain
MTDAEKWKKQYRPSRSELAEWMRRSRKIAGLTQLEMAEVLKMTPEQLNGYEKANTVPDEAMTKHIISRISWQIIYAYEDDE